MRVLVVNAGSSSVKLRAIDDGAELAGSSDLDAAAGEFDSAALEAALDDLGAVDAIGHRVVHGGPRFAEPVLLTDEVVAALRDLVELAPLHQPHGLRAIDAVARLRPGVPMVACFDTAFHATLPAAATTYAVPREWRERWGLRRYGFHGLSHAWAARWVSDRGDEGSDAVSGVGGPRRVVTCHLGAGASLAAVLDGRCVDTTMGFTPLEGLVMATRSGSVDPGMLLWLLDQAGLEPAAVHDALDRRSGLAALAGSADMRDVLAGLDRGDDDARLAFDVYVHVLVRHVGAMAASLGGLDAIAFTGGVGEHAAPVRAAAAERLAWLGVEVDADRNDDAHGDAEITGTGAAARAFVVTAREDLEIDRAVRALLPG